MAFPTVVTRTESAITAAGDPLVTFSQVTGELVIIFLAIATAQTITVGDGFVNLTNTNATFHILHKMLDGSEGGDAQVTLGTNAKAAWISYNITGFDTDQIPEFSVVATSTSTTPDPDTVTPAGGPKDFLWLAGIFQAGEEADDDTWCNSAPTNFTNLVQKTTGVGGTPATNCSVAAANFASNATSMDPGTFSVDQSLVWRAYTVAVHPAPPPPPSGMEWLHSYTQRYKRRLRRM